MPRRKKIVDELIDVLRGLGFNIDSGAEVIEEFDELVTICSRIQSMTRDKPYMVLRRILDAETPDEKIMYIERLKKILGKYGYIIHKDLEKTLITMTE